MIAIGYSSGTILVYDLTVPYRTIDQRHHFSFHRSAVTCISFFSEETQMASGSQDTYIIIYDLVADTASFKLMGHSDHVTSLATFNLLHSLKGIEQQILVSGSKDGLLKFWDLTQQTCIVSVSDEYLSSIESFTFVPELKIVIAGSTDNKLRIFKVSQNKDTSELECLLSTSLRKDSNQRALELIYHSDQKLLSVLSSDNKLEVFKVTTEKKESLLKKLFRTEKRKALKRKRKESEQDDGEDLKELNIDKTQI